MNSNVYHWARGATEAAHRRWRAKHITEAEKDRYVAIAQVHNRRCLLGVAHYCNLLTGRAACTYTCGQGKALAARVTAAGDTLEELAMDNNAGLHDEGFAVAAEALAKQAPKLRVLSAGVNYLGKTRDSGNANSDGPHSRGAGESVKLILEHSPALEVTTQHHAVPLGIEPNKSHTRMVASCPQTLDLRRNALTTQPEQLQAVADGIAHSRSRLRVLHMSQQVLYGTSIAAK